MDEISDPVEATRGRQYRTREEDIAAGPDAQPGTPQTAAGRDVSKRMRDEGWLDANTLVVRIETQARMTVTRHFDGDGCDCYLRGLAEAKHVVTAIRSESAGTRPDELDVRSAVFQAGLAQGRAESAGTPLDEAMLAVVDAARASHPPGEMACDDGQLHRALAEYARLSSSDTGEK